MIKRFLALSLALILTVSTVGCSWASFAREAQLLAPTLISILQFVAAAKGVPFDQALAHKINDDTAEFVKIGNDFHAASKEAQGGIVPQFNAAWGVMSSDIDQVFSLAQVGGAQQQKADELIALAGAVIPLVEAFIPNAEQAKASRKHSSSQEAPGSRRQFVIQFNAILDQPSGNKGVDDAARKLHIHDNSKVVRVLTFGVAK